MNIKNKQILCIASKERGADSSLKQSHVKQFKTCSEDQVSAGGTDNSFYFFYSDTAFLNILLVIAVYFIFILQLF